MLTVDQVESLVKNYLNVHDSQFGRVVVVLV